MSKKNRNPKSYGFNPRRRRQVATEDEIKRRMEEEDYYKQAFSTAEGYPNGESEFLEGTPPIYPRKEY